MRFVPFDMDATAWNGRLDALRWRFHKWDLFVKGRCTVARGALVLSRKEHEALVDATERLAVASRRARSRMHPEDAASLGLDARVAELAGQDGAGSWVTRIDFFQTADGWRASEFNDDVPGGFNDAIGLPGVFHDALPDSVSVPGDLPEALHGFLAPAGTERVGLLYATGYAEDQQVLELFADLLAMEGVESCLGSPASVTGLDGDVSLGEERVDRLYRFFPVEWFPLLPNAAAWRSSHLWGAHVVNPFSTAWTQSKAIFSWLHEHADANDRDAVARYLPRTVLLDQGAAERALADPDRYVLKPAFGRMGEGVTLGAFVSRDSWRKRVVGALRESGSRRFVLQNRFVPHSVELGGGEAGVPCIGAYAVDGRFAGYYGRLSRKGVTGHDATNVLVVVEGL